MLKTQKTLQALLIEMDPSGLVWSKHGGPDAKNSNRNVNQSGV
jgi:hypothetical protein